MNPAVLEETIIDRLTGDTGSGGLLASGASLISNVYNHFRNPSDTLTDKPYIVVAVEDWTQDETYDTSGLSVNFRIHLFGASRGGTTGLRTIIDRVFGNWKPGTAPTYGLHRWFPGAIAGTTMSVSAVYCTGGGTDHTDDYYQYVLRYSAVVTDTRA